MCLLPSALALELPVAKLGLFPREVPDIRVLTLLPALAPAPALGFAAHVCALLSLVGAGDSQLGSLCDIPPVSKLTQPPSINSLNFCGCHGNTIRGLSV